MTNHAKRLAAILAGGCAAFSLAACMSHGGMAGMASPAPQGQPGVPASGPRADADNQAVLDAMTMRLNLRPYHTLSPAEARRQPTFTDGVMEVMRQQNRPTTPPPGVAVREMAVGGGAGMIPAMVYRPEGATGPLPVIVYFHGGGWVIADPMVYDASARALVREAQAIVVSVNYRKAPENKFPAQHDDALAAYRWVLSNAASMGGDPSRVALAGESAGGNLALATAVAARDAGLQAPSHVLAVYPIGGSDLNTPSYQDSGNALPLNRAGMAWFLHHVMRSPSDLVDPRINLMAANFRGLAPVTIVQAQIDPLRSDGDMLVARLRSAGVNVASRRWDGATHEFFGADAVIRDAGEAQRFAGERLRAAFGARR